MNNSLECESGYCGDGAWRLLWDISDGVVGVCGGACSGGVVSNSCCALCGTWIGSIGGTSSMAICDSGSVYIRIPGKSEQGCVMVRGWRFVGVDGACVSVYMCVGVSVGMYTCVCIGSSLGL